MHCISSTNTQDTTIRIKYLLFSSHDTEMKVHRLVRIAQLIPVAVVEHRSPWEHARCLRLQSCKPIPSELSNLPEGGTKE